MFLAELYLKPMSQALDHHNYAIYCNWLERFSEGVLLQIQEDIVKGCWRNMEKCDNIAELQLIWIQLLKE